MSHQDRVFFGNFMAVLAFIVVAAFAFYFIAKSVVNSDDSAGENTALTQVANENIKPIGTVVVAGESSSSAAAAGPRSGTDVYNSFCMACHATGAAGAPKVGDKAAWAPRANKGLDGLLATANSGLNAMPPKGTCGDCSDDELKGAIRHMLTETGIKVAGGEAAAPTAKPAAAASASNGKQVYDSACMACHATGAAGAPKLGDAAAWGPRIAQGKDTLVKHALGGLNAMPPRGACGTCSDDDIKAAVSYMVDNSK